MRSLLIILASILLLAAGFVAYFWLQPQTPVAATERTHSAATQPVLTAEGPGLVQRGRGVWVKTLDRKTGRIASEFRAAETVPSEDGTISVTAPEARFYLNDDRVLVIRGARGQVVVPRGTSLETEELGRTQSAMPTRGDLQEVTIALLSSPDAAQPLLVCRMNNATFDNDTFRIATERYTDERGSAVAADQVPVEVRGVDYDFDGRGLTIRWNELDRRLQLLEIAHGERLVIKNPDRELGAALETSMLSRPGPMLAAADDAVIGEIVSAPPPSAEPDSGLVYRAAFHAGVRIVQDEVPIAQGNLLRIDFRLDEKRAAATTAPPDPTPATAPVEASERPHEPAEAPPDEPSVAQSPITIYWTGPLRVTPREPQGAPTLAPGHAAVHLQGTPGILQRDGRRIEFASVTYHSADESALIESSADYPEVTLEDENGMELRTPLIKIINGGETAILKGRSSALLPMEQSSGGEDEAAPMKVQWHDTARFTFMEVNRQRMIERADMVGQVQVEHPQVKMQSRELKLAFEPAAAGQPDGEDALLQAQLRDVTAIGEVRCIINPASEDPGDFAAQRLQIFIGQSDRGELYARMIEAEGDVQSSDSTQNLRAGHLVLLLAPARQARHDQAEGSVQVALEKMVARQDVQITTTDGGCASGDELTIERKDAQYHFKLLGQPQATLVSDGRTLVGPIIELDTAAKQASVVGPGRLITAHQPDAEKAPQPLDVSWSEAMLFDGSANTVQVDGDVRVESKEGELTTHGARSRSLRMMLSEAPAVQPEQDAEEVPTNSDAADATPVAQRRGMPASRRAFAADDLDLSFLENKQIEAIRLLDDVEVLSTELGADGTLLRRMNLQAAAVEYDLARQQFAVPGPGKLLIQDDRPRAKAADGAEGAPGEGALRQEQVHGPSGATAFAWSRELRFDREQRQLQMAGDVVIVNQASDLSGRQLRLEAQLVRADLAEVSGAEAQQGDFFGGGTMRLRLVTAETDVVFRSEQLRFQAAWLSYDPSSETVEARGSDAQRIVMYDEQGVSTGSMDALWYNLETEQLRTEGFTGGTRK